MISRSPESGELKRGGQGRAAQEYRSSLSGRKSLDTYMLNV